MKITRLFLFSSLMALSACMWGTPSKKVQDAITKDTLLYTYKNVKERAADCKTTSDSGCTVFSMHYPLFKNAPALNTLLRVADTAIAADKKGFFYSYEDDKKDASWRMRPYESSDDITVLRQDSS